MNYRQAEDKFLSNTLTSDDEIRKRMRDTFKRDILNKNKGKIKLLNSLFTALSLSPSALLIIAIINDLKLFPDFINMLLFITTLPSIAFLLMQILENFGSYFYLSRNKDKIEKRVNNYKDFLEYLENNNLYKPLDGEDIQKLNKKIIDTFGFNNKIYNHWKSWLSSVDSIRVIDKQIVDNLVDAYENEKENFDIYNFKLSILEKNQEIKIKIEEREDDLKVFKNIPISAKN